MAGGAAGGDGAAAAGAAGGAGGDDLGHVARHDQPGIQIYGGNFLDGKVPGKAGKPYPFRSAICMETQFFPDSPNQPEFPSVILNPGETYTHTCIYKFSVKQ